MASGSPVNFASQKEPSVPGRMAFFDVVRGFSVVSMVLFHLCYDLRYVYGLGAAWFEPPLQDIWRASISWVFLFVAGCMCSFSRNAVLRARKYLLAALAIWIVTTIVAVDVPISFGIIFCMGASTLIEHLLASGSLELRGPRTAFLLLVAFLLLRGVPRGYVGIGPATMALPHQLYASRWLSFVGLPGPGFASGDYYPIIPFTLMYLTGTAMGRHWKAQGYPEVLTRLSCAPLEWVGRHALPIYLLHQPLIVAVLELVVRLG